MPLDDLIVLVDDSSIPAGYSQDPVDVNQGAGGRYLYFAYHIGNGVPITDIRTVYGDDRNVTIPQSPSGQPYQKIGVDLNLGAGGKYIYACTTTDPAAGAAITGLKVIAGNSPNIQPEAPYQRDGLDLNLGAGGDYVYLCYSRQ